MILIKAALKSAKARSPCVSLLILVQKKKDVWLNLLIIILSFCIAKH